MLKRIAKDQVRIGMFIHGFEGSWFDHPFWRKKFQLTDARDVEKIRASAINVVIIDVSRGTGPDEPAKPRSSAASALPKQDARPPAPRKTAAAPPPQSEDKSDERRATLVVDRSKQVMRDLYASVRLGKTLRPAIVMPVVEDITDEVMRNARAVLNVMRLKKQAEYTYFHSVAVCALMVNVGRQLGMEEPELHQMGLAGLLHDMGKVIVPEEVLNKPGSLSDAEFALVRTHPEHGHNLLRETGEVPDLALNVCLHHHERMDGRGYPYGLSANKLDTAARLGAICDVYDALTANRPYKDAWTPTETISAMQGWSGHFDPDLLFRFMQSVGVFPTGMLVRLRSNRLGIVLEPARRATRPRVRTFYSTTERCFIEPELVVITDNLGGDQIMGQEQPLNWGLTGWDMLSKSLLSGESLPRDLMRA
jgi:HD-GYP domain-containing protein (c-di-GMP phosphodiesterase class II)